MRDALCDEVPVEALRDDGCAPRRRHRAVRGTALEHTAHVRAWVRHTAEASAVAQMSTDFDFTGEP